MGNPTPAYLLKRDQEMRDRLTAAAEAEQKQKDAESEESIDSDKSVPQPK
jgi:hypothetical protein